MNTLDNMTRAELEQELTDTNKVLDLLSPEAMYIDAREPYVERVELIQEYLKQQDMLDLIGASDNVSPTEES